MNRTEAIALCRYAKAACPQQTFDEYTPDVWFDLLGDLSLADCKFGVQESAKVKPFVAPAEIRAAVKRIRTERIREFESRVMPYPPPGLSDMDELAWRRDLRARVADGAVTAADFEAPVTSLSDRHVLGEIARRMTPPTPTETEHEETT